MSAIRMVRPGLVFTISITSPRSISNRIIASAIERKVDKNEKYALCKKLINAIEKNKPQETEHAQILADLYEKTSNLTQAYEYYQMAITWDDFSDYEEHGTTYSVFGEVDGSEDFISEPSNFEQLADNVCICDKYMIEQYRNNEGGVE